MRARGVPGPRIHHNARLKELQDGMEPHTHNFKISGEILEKIRELENLVE